MEASNWAFVSAAYIATWALVLGYLAFSERALRRARAEFRRATGRLPGQGPSA